MSKDNSRAKLMQALHAEAAKRGMDHDALRDVARMKFGVASMGLLKYGQLKQMFYDMTGKFFIAHKAKVELPRRGYGKKGELEIVSGSELELLERAFAKRGWGPETKAQFIRRQLNGREQIRTRADFHRVFSGIRAMNRRDGL